MNRSIDPIKNISEQLSRNESIVRKFELCRRLFLLTVTVFSFWCIIVSDFFYIYAEDNFAWALESSHVFHEDVYKWPLKWVLSTMIIGAIIFNEICRFYVGRIISNNEKLKNHHHFLASTDFPLLQKIRGKYDIDVVECPTCGRKSRIPAGQTFLATCGNCGDQWTTQG